MMTIFQTRSNGWQVKEKRKAGWVAEEKDLILL